MSFSLHFDKSGAAQFCPKARYRPPRPNIRFFTSMTCFHRKMVFYMDKCSEGTAVLGERLKVVSM
jgi:hypothetical protein